MERSREEWVINSFRTNYYSPPLFENVEKTIQIQFQNAIAVFLPFAIRIDQNKIKNKTKIQKPVNKQLNKTRRFFYYFFSSSKASSRRTKLTTFGRCARSQNLRLHQRAAAALGGFSLSLVSLIHRLPSFPSIRIPLSLSLFTFSLSNRRRSLTRSPNRCFCCCF